MKGSWARKEAPTEDDRGPLPPQVSRRLRVMPQDLLVAQVEASLAKIGQSVHHPGPETLADAELEAAAVLAAVCELRRRAAD